MRTWTLAFLLVSGVLAATLMLDQRALALLGSGAFTIAVFAALLAGMRRAALQMATLEAQRPPGATGRREGERSTPEPAPRRAAREAR